MNDSYLDLSVLIDSTPGPNPEVRDRLAARLQMLIESEQVGARQRHRGWQRASWTHRAGVIAVAAAIVVVFFVPLPHVSLFNRLSQGQNGVSPGGSIIPKDWVPVVDGAAQIAVPAAWSVLYDWPDCPFGKVPGLVLVNPTPTACPAPPPGDTPANVIELYRYVPDKLREYPQVINGITVYGTRGNWYDVPALGVALAIHGPLGRRVLNTLTRSPQGRNTTTTVPKPLPVVDLSATPAGWVPVAYGDLQLSIPSSWVVAYDSALCGSARAPGELWVNPVMLNIGGCLAPTYAKTEVQLQPLGKARLWNTLPRQVINGITVYGGHSSPVADYFVPSLGSQVILWGPLGRKVLETLTFSPRSVVLANVPAPVAPSTWRTLSFSGISFAVPASWPVIRYDTYGPPCGGVSPGYGTIGVFLDTDSQLAVSHCGELGYSSPKQATDGLSVNRLPTQFFPASTRYGKCLKVHGLTACPATSPAYSVLVLKVTVPGRSTPAIVSTGLAGNGMVARTILYSLRGVRAAQSATGIASCRASQVSVGFFGSGVGNPGEAVTAIKLTNTSSSPCSLRGYPVVRFLSKGGAVMPVTVGHTSGFFGVLATVVLAPGKAASTGFFITGPDFPATGVSCPTAASMRVRLPKITDWSTVATPLRLCRLAVYVSPIVKGSKLAPLL